LFFLSAILHAADGEADVVLFGFQLVVNCSTWVTLSPCVVIESWFSAY